MDFKNPKANLLENSPKVDWSALEIKLQMTYEERLEAHEQARELVEDLMEAGQNLYAKPQRSS